MRLLNPEMVEDAPKIVGKIRDRERPLVIVAVAVAPRIPCENTEVRSEMGDLAAPVLAIAADAVQENERVASTFVPHRDARRRTDLLEGHAAVSCSCFPRQS